MSCHPLVNLSPKILFNITQYLFARDKITQGHGACHIWELKFMELSIWSIKATQTKIFKWSSLRTVRKFSQRLVFFSVVTEN